MWGFQNLIPFNGPSENTCEWFHLFQHMTSDRCSSNISWYHRSNGCSLLSLSDIPDTDFPHSVIFCPVWICERHYRSGPSNTCLLATEKDWSTCWFFFIQIWAWLLSRIVIYIWILSVLIAGVFRGVLFKFTIKVLQVWKSENNSDFNI